MSGGERGLECGSGRFGLSICGGQDGAGRGSDEEIVMLFGSSSRKGVAELQTEVQYSVKNKSQDRTYLYLKFKAFNC